MYSSDHILIPVRKPHSTAILSGKETILLKKGAYPAYIKKIVWFYEAGKDGARKIIGSARLSGIFYFDCLEKDYEQCDILHKAGKTLDEAKKMMPCLGWELRDVQEMPRYVSLKEIFVRDAPKTYMYLSERQSDMLTLISNARE